MRRKAGYIIATIAVLFVVVVGFKLAKFVPVLYQLLFHHDIALKTAAPNRINIVLLGIGGGSHDGPNLTDTIIFASIDPAKDTVSMVSIPRDLWIDDMRARINTAYAYGEDRQKGAGLILAKGIVGKILDQPIDYGVRIDFSGFEKAVDLVGGLDIMVENTFDDYAYPVSGKENETCGHDETEIASLSAQIATGSATDLEAFPCRYMHLHFDKGLIHMDGKTALEYVRSRHALGIEGSDFSRSKRQQKVISAFRQKLISANTLLDPTKVIGLYNTLSASIDTDIRQDEFDDFIRLAQKMKGAEIKSAVIDQGDDDREGLLVNPVSFAPYGGAWVLIPKAGDDNFSQIQAFVACQVGTGPCPTPTPSISSGTE